MNSLLEAKNIFKTYDRTILNSLDLSIRRAEFVSIIGKSGSGKSTLLHILGGLLKPDKGYVAFYDKDIYSDPVFYRKNNVGFVFQFFHLIESITIYENIVLPLRIVKRSFKEDKVFSLLKKFDLYHLKNHYPSSLSGGEKQRVAFIRAIIKVPDILLCDEPTGNLDDASSKLIISAIKDFNSMGGSVVLVTHNKELLYGSIYELKNGRLTAI